MGDLHRGDEVERLGVRHAQDDTGAGAVVDMNLHVLVDSESLRQCAHTDSTSPFAGRLITAMSTLIRFVLSWLAALALVPAHAQLGYFRQPTLHNDTLVFVAEGDLWRTSIAGGSAQRLTTHAGQESYPAISPDGKWLAFSARYEGPIEIYVMSLTGGAPKRLTYDGGGGARVQGWTPDGKVLQSTARLGGKPVTQLFAIDPVTAQRTQLPLFEAAEGCYIGAQLLFTRRPMGSDNLKHYRGGLAQNIWRFDGASEAQVLTGDYAGTSRQPMCGKDRVYFLSDRDGTMNIWSMRADGRDLKRHTRHTAWDIRSASLSAGKIAYHLGADVRILDLDSDQDRIVPIALISDFDQLRTRWIKNPFDFQTHTALSPNGDRVALTARGNVHVLPVGAGRRIEVTRGSAVRARNAAFSADGRTVYAITDQSDEQELWRYAANGSDQGTQLSRDAVPIREGIHPSPDGKWVIHAARGKAFYVFDTASNQSRTMTTESIFDVDAFDWSPDSKWVAFRYFGRNGMARIGLLELASGTITPLTGTRYGADTPRFSSDGQFLYFISDRNLQSVVRSPWGPRNPEPFFDRQSKLYALALRVDAKWPFQPKDELLAKPAPETKPDAATPPTETSPARPVPPPAAPKPVVVNLEGITERLYEVPLPPGNYTDLSTDGKRLYFVSSEASVERKLSLRTLPIEPIGNAPPQSELFFDDIKSFQLSQDHKKVLLRKANELWVVDAGAKAPTELAKFAVNLRDWTIQADPRAEWAQMYVDAWRMHRDYFWDEKMHGADWLAVRKKYEPLLARITDRAELDDVLAQMISEAAALHSQVVNADLRKGNDEVDVATLGAALRATVDGYRVEKLFGGDPELLEERSPLARSEVNVQVGDLITHANGTVLTSPLALESALRLQTGKQVLLTIRAAASGAVPRDVVVVPISAQRDGQLRYLSWERERMLRAEAASQSRIGYVHLQAMGANDIARWAREFYPVFDREGLILDLRNNFGGNIDSWIIEKLQRRAWHFWKARRSEQPYWNQQQAFRGHVVALIDHSTYSDGETISEGLKRLGIATLIGTRTAGAGIWLSDQNGLRDGGRARVAEMGVFVSTPKENRWIIEGEGVTPDVEVDNLPYATFNGGDAQLDAGVRLLLEKMAKDPVRPPVIPPPPTRAQKPR
jgi:tricorn protease